MIIGGPTTRILGLAALISASGCGSGSGRPTDPPPAVAPADVPSATEREAESLDPEIQALPMAPKPISGFRRPCDAPLRAPAVATGDPELDPLVSYLKVSFVEAITTRKGIGTLKSAPRFGSSKDLTSIATVTGELSIRLARRSAERSAERSMDARWAAEGSRMAKIEYEIVGRDFGTLQEFYEVISRVLILGA